MAGDNKSLELQIRIATQEALRAVSGLKGEVKALADEAKKYAGGGGGVCRKTSKASFTNISQAGRIAFFLKKVVYEFL